MAKKKALSFDSAVKVDQVGAPQRHDDPGHQNQGLVPVQFVGEEKGQFFPAGTSAKAGDYLVTVGTISAFVDGALWEALNPAEPTEEATA